MLSDELHLLVHPFRGYRVMATRQDPQPRGTLLERVLVTQVVLAGAVSLLTAGRMSLRLMLGTMLAWLMVPVIQLAVIMLTHWVSGTRCPISRLNSQLMNRLVTRRTNGMARESHMRFPTRTGIPCLT